MLLLVIYRFMFLSGIAAAFELFRSSKSNIFDSDFIVYPSDSFIISGKVSCITVKLYPSFVFVDVFIPVVVQVRPSWRRTSRSVGNVLKFYLLS